MKAEIKKLYSLEIEGDISEYRPAHSGKIRHTDSLIRRPSGCARALSSAGCQHLSLDHTQSALVGLQVSFHIRFHFGR